MKRIIQLPYFHLAIGILSIALLYFSSFFFNQKKTNYSAFNHKLNQNEVLAESVLSESIEKQKTNFSFSKQQIDLYQSLGLSFYIIEESQVQFWTNRNVLLPEDLNVFKGSGGAVQLPNGWYQYLIKKSNSKAYLALILVKNSYTIKNNYLNNSFHKNYQLKDEYAISLTKETRAFDVKSVNGDYLFSIQQLKSDEILNHNNWFLLVLFFAGYLFLI